MTRYTTRLALAMIVRDEATQLPAFFAHHEGLADEIVVVDTGSRDNSRDLAVAAGAVVVDHPWQDDFAAARNAGLDAVTADWIIFLDADERVSQADFAEIRQALPPQPDRVFLQESWNYCLGLSHLEWQPLSGRYPVEEAGQTGMFVARRVGVFPRLAKLRFSGRVHETVLTAAEARGLAVLPLAVPVHHYGYAKTAAVNEARQQRYRRLVELKYADDPSDPAAQLELATILLESGEPAAAMVHLEEVAAGPPGLRPVVRGLVLQGRLRREMGELVVSGKLLAVAVDQDPDFLFGWLELIRTAAQAEDWGAAENALAVAEGRFGGQNPQLLRESLRIKVKTGQLAAALQTADELVTLSPQWAEIRALRDRLQRMTGRH
ncbi:MAG: glycosyltransferase [Candidatus Krumholzibacteria bacterium]|nr:glycosyltransferase [Candidatus Krumholzibacteria bacterium]